MTKKLVLAILFVFLMLMTIITPATIIPITPVKAWEYQDGTPSDTKYEKFGPRADKLLINLYSSAEDEWDALEHGEIDITDWPLSKLYYDKFTTPPLNESINVVGYGSGYGFYMLDINNNKSSPVYPNPCSVLSFRQAIAYLVDRRWLDIIIGQGLYEPIWVPMSPALGKYYLNISNPYPYDPDVAKTLLNADGFPVNAVTGWRYWDRNGNGMEDPGEYLELKFIIRTDNPYVLAIGDMITNELRNVNVRVNGIYVTSSEAYIIVVLQRDFHLYVGPASCTDPGYLYWAFHSTRIPTSNFNGVNDTELDYWLEQLIQATTQIEAVIASHNAQQVFVNKSFKVPLWTFINSKAMYRRYTGGTSGNIVLPDDGENQYRNQYWQGTVNVEGLGIDNFLSFLNMHPTGYAYGHNENMTIRWGFKFNDIKELNPIYASWSSDWNVLNLVYDRLIRQDPYSSITEPKWMPWLAKKFTVSKYIHPLYGVCAKVNFTLRTDVTWSDGTPFTTADVEFTLVDLDELLQNRGYPVPWWYSNVADILDLKIFDPYNFEVLFRTDSVEELYYGSVLPAIENTPILPKHIWKPIVVSGDPTGFAPNPNLIGSGPWRLKEYIPNTHVLLIANKPGSVVQTNQPDSTPITSPKGYFQYYPVHEDIHFKPPYEYRHKIPPDLKSIEFKVTLENLIREHMIIENITNVNLTNPVGSEWHETWPIESVQYWFTEWVDNGDMILSPSDIIGIAPTLLPTEWYYIGNMWWKPDPINPGEKGVWVLELKPVLLVNKHLYIDNLVEEPIPVYLNPEIPHEQQRLFQISVGLHTIKVEVHIKEPNWDSWKLYCKWVNHAFIFWVTIKEDIAGSTFYDDLGLPSYPYKSQLPSPDIKVDGRDRAVAQKAFGSYPGHPRWASNADIDGDYKVDGKDQVLICKKFGWGG